ncbi:MAG: MmgE/PrpD family protein [Pseudolabrys sp.]
MSSGHQQIADEEIDALAGATRWLAGVDRLPPEVVAKARLLLLDTVGCLIAGLGHREVAQFADALRVAFPGTDAWLTSAHTLGPAGLAALGAAAICWDEACDGHSGAHGRPALPVIPALLALSTTQQLSLGDILLGLVTGYEIAARAGELWRIPPGWHVDGSWHSLGVAAAVARLMRGPDAMQPAIEAVACQIPASLYWPITHGSVVRNTYPAHAALLGMMAAAAATAGFAMPEGTFAEARRRILRAADAGETMPPGRWMILDGYIKPYAGVRHAHYGVAAALRLRERHGIAPESVEAIRLAVYAEAAQYCNNRAPRTAIQAQFSMAYAVAAALVLGDLGPAAYANLDHPLIRALEQRVTVVVDPERTRRGARVTLTVAGRDYTESVDDVAGDPSLPMTREETVAKFHRYLDPIIGAARARDLVQLLLQGDDARDVRACFNSPRG